MLSLRSFKKDALFALLYVHAHSAHQILLIRVHFGCSL